MALSNDSSFMQVRGNKCIGYIALNGTTTASNELKWLWKKKVVAHLQYVWGDWEKPRYIVWDYNTGTSKYET
jgi:hypothetical protein